MSDKNQKIQDGVDLLVQGAGEALSTESGQRLMALLERVDASDSEAHILAFIVGAWMSRANDDAVVKNLLALVVDYSRRELVA